MCAFLGVIKYMENERISHPIPPFYGAESEILILGSFPSVKSRETGFYYGHPQNRFWRVLALLYGETEALADNQAKREFLSRHGIALWDVIASCEISGSADSGIKNAVPNDISKILTATGITRIFVNGRTADKLYRRHIEAKLGVPAVYLPSTSPANASYSLERLEEEWRKEIFR